MKIVISSLTILLFLYSCQVRKKTQEESKSFDPKEQALAEDLISRFLDSMGYPYFNQTESLAINMKRINVSGDTTDSYIQMDAQRTQLFFRNNLTYNDVYAWGYGKGWRFDFSNGATEREKIDSATAWKFVGAFELYFKIVEGYLNNFREDYISYSIITESDTQIVVELESAMQNTKVYLDPVSLMPIQYHMSSGGTYKTIQIDQIGKYYGTPVKCPEKFSIYENGKLVESVDVYHTMFTQALKESHFEID